MSFNLMAAVTVREMEQDPMIFPPVPTMSSACLFSVENFNQRISLIREMRICENKGKQSKETKQ